MNRKQREVELAKLADEEKELNQLKAIYSQASDDIQKKVRISSGKINFLLSGLDNLDEEQKSILQSQIYQKQFQESLRKQIDGFTEKLATGQYKSVKGYMERCYETGYIGTIYDIAGQGIPLAMPIDQKKVARAMTHDTKLSVPLYRRLGIDLDLMKKQVANSISRGIATASGYSVIARNIALDSKAGFSRAMRIARTEGHRIQVLSAVDAQHDARDAGADVAKQWDAALDGRTRPHHRELDGQVRELDEPFEVAGMTAMYPSAFGLASEDINCRCALLQRAKWALDEDELEVLKERAAYFGLDKAKDFVDFKKKYLVVQNTGVMNLYLKNIKRKKGDEINAALDSYASLPDKARKAFAKITFDYGYNASACDIMNRAIQVGANASKEDIDHEFGHLIEHELMDADEVKAYKRYLVEGLTGKDIFQETFHDNTGKEVIALVVKGDRFVGEYQGYLYYDDIDDLINADGSINIDCMGETISEPFRMYCSGEKINDNKIIDMIERAVK